MAIETTIWIYWLFCAMATFIVLRNRQFAYTLLSPDLDSPQKEQNKTIFLILGWVLTLLASVIYISFTVKKQTGAYELPDLICFSLLNGVLEQFTFVFWFLVGCHLAQKKLSKNSVMIFISGYVVYFLYSGAIHPLFWFKVLPEHEPFMPMAFILPFMSFFWMWLFWRYRAVVPILAMHVAIDFLTVGHLHFHWFESFQLMIMTFVNPEILSL